MFKEIQEAKLTDTVNYRNAAYSIASEIIKLFLNYI